MVLLYPAVVPCSVILSLIAVDCFTGPTINSADLYDIGVAQFHQFFRCLLTPITAAAVYQNQLIFIRQFRDILCANGFVGNIDSTGNMLFAIFLSSTNIEDDVSGFLLHHRNSFLHSNLSIGFFSGLRCTTREKLESYLSKGNISAIVYSNPNNPSWICLKEEELRIIGELATQYDVIVLEDLAYFAMDFRQDLSKPFQAPYQPSVAHYTDYYVLLISGSKAFSYAGQRIGVSCISNKLYHRAYPGLTQRYGGGTFGTVFIHRVLYALSSGTSHSAQYALAAMLKAANEGQYNFLDEVKVYGERARRLKEIFLRHGFHLVYDNDLGDPVADGFYFTIGYPGMSSGELARELMYYGVSAISLVTTGSHQEGLRACTSFIQDHQYDQLDERMAIFAENHPIQ